MFKDADIVQRLDGYWNTTAMCPANRQELSACRRYANVTDVLNELSRPLQICRGVFEQSIASGPNKLRGICVHERVVIYRGVNDRKILVNVHVQTLLGPGPRFYLQPGRIAVACWLVCNRPTHEISGSPVRWFSTDRQVVPRIWFEGAAHQITPLLSGRQAIQLREVALGPAEPTGSSAGVVEVGGGQSA